MSTMVREGGGTADRKHLSGQAFAREAGAVLQQFTDMLAAVSQESASTVHRIDEIAKKFDEVSKLVERLDQKDRPTPEEEQKKKEEESTRPEGQVQVRTGSPK